MLKGAEDFRLAAQTPLCIPRRMAAATLEGRGFGFSTRWAGGARHRRRRTAMRHVVRAVQPPDGHRAAAGPGAASAAARRRRSRRQLRFCLRHGLRAGTLVVLKFLLAQAVLLPEPEA